jgi:ABC-type antimicrobial peptide transport system permease subunit
LQQTSFLRDRNLVGVVRIAGVPTAIAETLRTVVRRLDATVPLTIQNVESRIGESLVQERLLTIIAVFLGAVSLVLACGALAGLMSHLVTARTREFGLRLALGAERRSVVGLVMRQALTVAVAGGIAGLGFSLAGGRLVASFLTTIGPSDPVALTAAASALLVTTAIAAYIPARRASRVEPMAALRAD